MIIPYPDTERELYFDTDYKPITGLLSGLNNTELIELLKNLENAFDNAYMNNADLLSIALYDDIVEVKKKILIDSVKSFSSGTIASFIGNTKYLQIDRAINKTLVFLFHAEEEDIFPLSVDMAGIKKLVCDCYKKQDL